MAELHGTGTALGDPIEVGALRGVMKRLSLHSVLSRVFLGRKFAMSRDRKVPIMKTSAKSNLAHGEANAGMAGFD